MATPFMEHPSGEFESAIDAMADAIKRLRSLPEWNNWITFCAQGMGPREDTYHIAEIRLRRNELSVDAPLDVSAITGLAGVSSQSVTAIGVNYSVENSSPEAAAKIMDTIFRNVLGIRPHTGEGDDYAIGAEW